MSDLLTNHSKAFWITVPNLFIQITDLFEIYKHNVNTKPQSLWISVDKAKALLADGKKLCLYEPSRGQYKNQICGNRVSNESQARCSQHKTLKGVCSL